MKAGRRVLGIAESYDGEESTLAGAVVRADRVVDGFAFASCAVGGTDATETICSLVSDLDREDLNAVLIAGIAPAWFNIVDLHRIHDRTGLPALSISFEGSPGLSATIESEFDDDAAARRLETYEAQPDRRELTIGGETLYCRNVGTLPTDADSLVRAFTPDGSRPEPLRVARLAARAADAYRSKSADS